MLYLMDSERLDNMRLKEGDIVRVPQNKNVAVVLGLDKRLKAYYTVYWLNPTKDKRNAKGITLCLIENLDKDCIVLSSG